MDATQKVVLVHDWLTGMRGGEKCLEVLCQRWPTAPLHTLIARPERVSPVIAHRPLQPSVLNWLPGVEHYYRYLLPILPAIAERAFRIREADLVVSFSHCVAKAAQAPAGVPHVCYCFTPMRYAWEMRSAYFAGQRLKATLVGPLLAALRHYDATTAARVTHFVAISRTVQARIQASYGRSSVVIYPPVDTDYYTPSTNPRADYYLAVSALAPYKRLDLAISACQKLGRRLVVIGAGQDAARLAKLAGPTTQLLGWQPDAVIRQHLRECRALLFPGEEDFGIVPLEAQACGTPVIALAKGGATETVIGRGERRAPTGVFFAEQTVESLCAALTEFEQHAAEFDLHAARANAVRFNPRRFASELFGYLDEVCGRTPTTQRRAA
jgi:glycosyltransferase involved in cell wall biosynthesis